jgi:hypothetical protein
VCRRERKVELELFILHRVLNDDIKFSIQFEEFFSEYLENNYNYVLINQNHQMRTEDYSLLAIKRDRLNELGI